MTTIASVDARVEYEQDNRSADDLEFDPITSEDEDYERATGLQITTYPADFTLEGLHQKWKAEEILIPDFQRRFVWKQVQASKLIESFLVGLPVPAVFLYTERKSQKYFVIDGQQRLKSIFYFIDGYFGPETKAARRRVFRLVGLSRDSLFNNKAFEDLHEEDQRKLRNSVLRAFIVQQLDPDDDTSIYHIFERLNTGGTLLTNQEIRNCVYHGGLIEFLDDINTDPAWRAILGKTGPDTRKKDIELLVRFFAMRDISGYKKPMKDFLSKFMKKNQDAPKQSLMENRKLFTDTCKIVVEKLGEKPFHIRAGLNAAVFDAVMTAFSKHVDEIPTDIADRYESLMVNNAFEENIRVGTTDVETVKKRFSQAEEILFG